MVDRDAAIPLYHQIFLQLRDEIVSGRRGYGSAMPTEEELSALFNVSRITARRVLDELAQHNFVARKRRIGTTVIFRSPVRPIEANIDQAMDALVTLDHGTQIRVEHVGMEPATQAVAEALRLPSDTDVLRTVRLRSLDGVPLGYIETYMPIHFAASVTQDTLASTPMLELLAGAGHKAHTAAQTISAMLADTIMADALEIEPRAAILRINRIIHDVSDTPVLLTSAHYRSDRFHIRLDLAHF